MDLIGLYANLLGNAIEGCLLCTASNSMTIEVRDDEKAGFYIVVVGNPKLSTQRFVNNRPPISKKGDYLQHGMGTKIIGDLAKKYDGAVLYQDMGSYLKTSVSLRNTPRELKNPTLTEILSHHNH